MPLKKWEAKKIGENWFAVGPDPSGKIIKVPFYQYENWAQDHAKMVNEGAKRADSIGDQSIPVSAKIDACLVKADSTTTRTDDVEQFRVKRSEAPIIGRTYATISGEEIKVSAVRHPRNSDGTWTVRTARVDSRVDVAYLDSDVVPELVLRKKQMMARFGRLAAAIQDPTVGSKLRDLMQRVRDANTIPDLDNIEHDYRSIGLDNRTRLDACVVVADSIIQLDAEPTIGFTPYKSENDEGGWYKVLSSGKRLPAKKTDYFRTKKEAEEAK